MAAQTTRTPARPPGRSTPAAPPADQRRPRPARTPAAGRGAPYLLILPALLATAALLVYPVVRNLVISFQNLNAFQLIQHTTDWTGFSNYTDQLTSGEFWHTTLRSVLFTIANVALIMGGGTLVGLLLNRLGRRMRLLLSTGLTLAWAMPFVAGTTVYQWLFDTQYGVVNWCLAQLGWHSMAGYNWLGNQFSTFAVITLMVVWQSIPFVALNLYAGLTTVSHEIFEAARMDGAGPWRTFRSVTYPILKPFFLSTTFLEIIWVFKAFTQVYALNAGGPAGSTQTLPVYAFIQGVGNQHFGMGAAISTLTMLILLALMAYYFRIILKQEDEL
ncbi:MULTISPECIES: carbohydrate ABC transporter permease [Streptomycetaceae]|uniref:Sugar transporter integral membrane protein n=1 Tax=Streptantibioticus cattleyicolor (strain ATCC 35852 / DSM 46488 / JCM 4925 / NBRC 14057 / NRRL 8057) TaxID=1003195 RepID=F8K4T9_STREN|nr:MULTISPECIES: sugar ABC transporter permease [Streptomycetaceae]AEW96454.1 sugar transporter integral membrane protein [Streptantibioticus cattleyicolor NRRL 8057 = DSM 46488]MYS60960.1 ABC transporter permease subunit [Streptomyces sp. SID5468]CCB76788.1 putative sugar transporter integral membrane protein [Streptantibioticus cattleyicolor NRRL 8057 = DSM 46488]